ncbi:PhzF family phenazine biosynthesis protein [Pseudoxanthomonas winnipegensis]|uniref:PhzF family phenazine biosynthesis protein n=1 Tax=Pseudoxanthomonas winnipegensis TaxID=2480810 RepID=UPI003F830831
MSSPLVLHYSAFTDRPEGGNPAGGVVEDPATGAAAAAFGAYLRALGAVQAPTDLHIVQGEDMGRPSQLRVHIPAAGPIRVSGRAVPIPAPAQAG